LVVFAKQDLFDQTDGIYQIKTQDKFSDKIFQSSLLLGVSVRRWFQDRLQFPDNLYRILN